MNITRAELIKMGACRDGLKRFIQQTGGTEAPVAVSSLVGGYNTTGDLLWLAGRVVPKDKLVRFACDCALLNIELIKPYTDKYSLLLEFLRKPDAAYAADARAAARAAYAAAYAADARAAARAAYAAAYAAARAADAAAYAADARAAYAADAHAAARAADAAAYAADARAAYAADAHAAAARAADAAAYAADARAAYAADARAAARAAGATDAVNILLRALFED